MLQLDLRDIKSEARVAEHHRTATRRQPEKSSDRCGELTHQRVSDVEGEGDTPADVGEGRQVQQQRQRLHAVFLQDCGGDRIRQSAALRGAPKIFSRGGGIFRV